MSAKQAAPSIIGKIFRAYEKPSGHGYCVVLENRYHDDVLLFENNTLCTATGVEFDAFKRHCVKIVDAYGCLGVLNVNVDNKLALFLVLVTGCQSVGKISDAEIFKVTQTTFVSLRKQQSDDYASEVRKLLNSGSFYFSRYVSQDVRFDLTLCAQRQWNNCVPDKRFFWNRNLHVYFIRFGINTTQWLMKIICGSIEIKTVYARHKQARIAIISRLSCRRAGTRFNVRGSNDDGYVANFVETEQVIYLDDEVTSFVQIRGSVPLFWEQPGMNVGAHKVKLSRSIESSADVYEKHVKSLKDCYGNIIFINLLGAANSNSKENESALSYAFEQKHSTSTFSFIPFVAFDYHQELKSNGDKSLQKLKSVVNPYLDSFGLFYAKGNSVIKHQTGSMRINCTDCLDRTNCIQKFFALDVLAKQLEFLCQNETDQIITRFEEVFQQLWVNNGNEISRIYAGTGAIQGGSKLLDGARSAARTIQNNLLDSSKQEGFDILLSGNALSNELLPKAKALLPYNTWQCHPDLVEEMCKVSKSYTFKSRLRIAVATYNVNGGKHFLNFDSNNLESLSKWLLEPYEVSLFDPSKEFFLNDTNNLPDIYAIGFEEIVDLNAGNIMAASSDNADSWCKNLKKILSSKSNYVLLTSTQLVGVCLFVFIKSELLPYIKDVTTDAVKTGMGGTTGNKGAVTVRFTLAATNLCFICAHFAAGQSQVADRNADFNEITRKMKIPIQSNDYVYWCGDFNYRVDMDRLDLINHVLDGDLDEVLKYDQLLAQYRDKKVFDNFFEAPITFPPTYKYDILSDEYDSSDKCRTPAWTDRVLWYLNENNDWPNGKQVFYGRAEIKESDHRPVMASYEIDILCVDQNKREQELNKLWNEYGPIDGVILVHIDNTDFPLNDETFKNIMLQGLGSFGKILNVRYFTDHAEITYENGRSAANALKIKQISINNYTLILTAKDNNWTSAIKNEIETITNNSVPLWTDKLRPAPMRPPLPARSDQSPSSDGMPNYPPPSNVPLPPLPPRQRLPPPLPPRNTTMMLNKWMQNLDPCSQDLYLCNFRVSVEGEWLCLREIADDPLSDIFPSQCLTSPDLPFLLDRDPVLIERRNLVNISKLIVKELIENSLKNGRMLDSDHAPLQHFFIVLEHVLRHGLRPKKGLLGPKKELWDILQIVEKLTSDAQELTNSIRDLPTVKTQMGRARAWLRVALMQKKLADYLKILVDNRDEELVDYFEPDALMMGEEAFIIVGLMVGLNVIDCNLCIKEEDLDSQQGVIDFSLYLRSSHHPNHHVQGTVSCPDSPLGLESDNMNVVLDQKNYIEELNCHLKATVANLESKVETLTTSNTLIREELDMAKNSLTTMKEENQSLKNQLIKKHDDSKNTESLIIDIPAGDMDTLKQFAENEKKQRIEAEKELHLQMSLKAEMEVAMKLLEKESREKQDNIVSLRKQLDDIKMINLEMYKKLQESEGLLKHKSEFVSKLESKNVTLTEALKKTEEVSKKNEEEKKKIAESVLKYNEQITGQTVTIIKLKEDLVKEQKSKYTLEERLSKASNQTTRLDEEIIQLKAMSNEYVNLQLEHYKLKEKYGDQDRALEELAGQLKKEILKSNELEEAANSTLAQAHWERDNEVANCKRCEKEFSITRRRHHCRNCGGIFCALCSDNTMMLPSSAKPVRVCDDCNLLLVERYSVVPNN